MQRFHNKIFCLIIISLLNSCEADFDVTAPYKETTVVYGLLNASDTVQWMRINKAFLGEGNAYDMAQHPDSINYPDVLDVKIEEYNYSGILLKTLKLVRDSSIQKNPGTFATTPNILYRTNVNDRINEQDKFKLVIYNRESGKLVTAQSNVVDSIYISYPYESIPPLQINWYQVSPVNVRWSTVAEGVVYQLTIRFHYDEIKLADTTNIQHNHLDWEFPEEPYTGQSQQLVKVIEKDDFYYFVRSKLTPDGSVKRKTGALDFIFTVGASEFYTYIQVNHPPTGINQSLPQYTNVDGGIGIFSSRLKQAVSDLLMTTQSEDSLAFGSITGNLGFY